MNVTPPDIVISPNIRVIYSITTQCRQSRATENSTCHHSHSIYYSIYVEMAVSSLVYQKVFAYDNMLPHAHPLFDQKVM